ncbi:MAG: radical SAM protein [Fusobacteriaceae bacterium]|jgi:oxygen-independent coproporphyrinogen-3 oxidase|nr:radical SAM protein [Fusobacteriaceae bacterium]
MDNILTLWPKRLKSHHDAASLVEKYQKAEKATEADFSAKLEERPENNPKAMYVHVPWCDRICSFCNMNRKQADAALTAYPARLAAELEKYGKTRYLRESRFEAIFFGGGTPTVLSTEQLATVLSALRKNVHLAEDCEFTFESTLHNLQEDKIGLLTQYGVNRISVGIQTFSERGRQFYNRTYNRQQALDKLRTLQKLFHGDVCVDIIYNFPGSCSFRNFQKAGSKRF